MEIYGVWVILIWGIVILLLFGVMVLIYNFYRDSHGKGRKIAGEIIRDIGIAFLVGAMFKYGVLELIFYILLIIGGLFVAWGTIMKEDKK